MQILQSENYIKLAASWDDQPGFVTRDRGSGGLSGTGPNRGTEGDEAIIDRWDGKKPKKKRKLKKIYQLGLDVEESPREEAEKIRHYESVRPIKRSF
jgi:hypothetical protein